jgi:hypothetical protein
MTAAVTPEVAAVTAAMPVLGVNRRGGTRQDGKTEAQFQQSSPHGTFSTHVQRVGFVPHDLRHLSTGAIAIAGKTGQRSPKNGPENKAIDFRKIGLFLPARRARPYNRGSFCIVFGR